MEIPGVIGLKDITELDKKSIDDYDIKDILTVVSLNLTEFIKNKDEDHIYDALDLLNTILLTYKCERIDEHYLFTPDHNLFVISKPIFAGD